MKLRRFVGPTMAVALAQVKETLGPEAMILESGAAAGGQGVEITAAVDHEPLAGVGGVPVDALHAEVRALSTLVRDLVGRAWGSRASAAHPELGALCRTLLSAGVDGGIAAALVEAATVHLGDRADVSGALAAAVEDGMAFGWPTAAPDPSGRRAPAVRLFVGPPGDGKTTTVAKLAGHAMLRAGRRVAVLSADTYRIGGAGELAAYARILGVPHAAVASGEEVRAALAQLGDRDEILVDTAGVGVRDPGRCAELLALVAGLDGVRSTLVVSATTAPAVARRMSDTLDRLRPDSCIVTKVDEALPAAALETCWQQKLPLAFFGTGRTVPGDLESASAERMATWLRAA